MSTLPDHERWMRLALEQADAAAAVGEVPVGAVVVAEGKVIGLGFNQPIRSHDPTAHAEIVALRQAAAQLGNYRLPGTTLYVTVEPCSMCAGAMVHARIAGLVFGAREPKAGAILSHPSGFCSMNHQVEVEGGVLGADCARRMTEFFERLRGR